MSRQRMCLISATLLLLPPRGGVAQQPPRLEAHDAADVTLDGRLAEPVWRRADSIANLTQIEPDEGAAPSSRTVVRVLADGSQIIVGVMAHDPRPDRITSFAVARDAELGDEDHLRLVFDPFLDGRSGVVFAVNPSGARYDALVARRGEGEDPSWDAVWDAATAVSDSGWSAEIRIPVRSLQFDPGLREWGFNVQRRIERLQETDRWASPERDYAITQTSRAGVLTGLPRFDLGLGLSVRPAYTGGGRVPGPGESLSLTGSPSLNATQRLGANLETTLTLNTDFAETEVDARRTNLTRFPLFFPEKRDFFLRGSDIFDFGLGLGRDLVPFFSRRIGLLEGREVPLDVGGKLNGRIGDTNVGAVAVRTGEVPGLAPASTMGVARIQQNVFRESSAGVIATFGDPRGRGESWMAGTDFTYQTSRLFGDKNFLVGVWGLATDREDLEREKTAAGFKIDYPNELWDVAVTYRRIGDGFRPSLGFVPRPGVQMLDVGVDFAPRPGWRLVRQMFYELRAEVVTDLEGELESYQVFTAPVNWDLESGDEVEFNVVPEGERISEPFEIAEGVTIPPGSYDWVRYRVVGEFAPKRKLSGEAAWWFGGFWSGSLHEVELSGVWNPVPLFTVRATAERDIGRLPQGDFTKDLARMDLQVNFSPDITLASLVQYDNESDTLGSNTRLRWTFHPRGELFVVHNHNMRDTGSSLRFGSSELLIKAEYEVRF